MFRKQYCFLLVALFLISFNVKAESQEVLDLLNKMTLQEKIGQVFMVGLSDKELSSQTKLFLKKYQFGNFILFSHNIKNVPQVKKLIENLKGIHSHPLFIATDQEGGEIVRLHEKEFRTPSAMALGMTQSEQLIYETASYIAYQLDRVGFNLNLAPVMDINTKGNTGVIGNRAFGNTPETVSQMGSAFIRGLQEGGMSATAKHFPGHGSAIGDSHEGFSILPYSLDKIKKWDLVPFKNAILSDVDVIMTAHVTPLGEKLPVTLSSKYLKDLLRDELHFQGLILSDDLEMDAVGRNYGLEKAVVQSFLAGTDMIMVTGQKTNQKKAYEALYNAVKSGAVSESRLNDSVKRILSIKLKRKAIERKVAQVPSFDFKKKIAEKVFTVIHKSDSFSPIEDHKKSILVITSLRVFYDDVKKDYSNAHFKYLKEEFLRSDHNELLKNISKEENKYDYIVVGFTRNTHVKFINDLIEKVKTPIIAVSFSAPYFSEMLRTKSYSYICTYDRNPESIELTLSYLKGEFKP